MKKCTVALLATAWFLVGALPAHAAEGQVEWTPETGFGAVGAAWFEGTSTASASVDGTAELAGRSTGKVKTTESSVFFSGMTVPLDVLRSEEAEYVVGGLNLHYTQRLKGRAFVTAQIFLNHEGSGCSSATKYTFEGRMGTIALNALSECPNLLDAVEPDELELRIQIRGYTIHPASYEASITLTRAVIDWE